MTGETFFWMFVAPTGLALWALVLGGIVCAAIFFRNWFLEERRYREMQDR